MKNLTSKFARLDAITAELGPLESQRSKLREEASQLAVDLIKSGAPPTEVAKRSPFSTAHVRTLARMAGLPPARRGSRRKDGAE